MGTTLADSTALEAQLRLPAEAISKLRCPKCHASVAMQGGRFRCTAPTCNQEFPVVDGIPIVIDESNSIFTFEQFLGRKKTYFPAQSAFKRTLLHLLPSLSRNWRSRTNYAAFANLLLETNNRPLVLIVGGGVVGVGAEAFLNRPEFRFVESDVTLEERTGLVCDAHDIPFVDGAFDGVVVQAVLEHVLDAKRCVAEIHRVLKSDGLILAETPFMQQVHGRQYDFTRFTLLGHRRLLRQFEEISSGASCGPGMALGWAYEYFLLSFTTFRTLRLLFTLWARFTAFWLKYLDIWLLSRPAALDAASVFFFIGRKTEKVLPDRELLERYRGGF